jgi:pSer/pThr/pTyr-binding forkhead associated (FHA) protein
MDPLRIVDSAPDRSPNQSGHRDDAPTRPALRAAELPDTAADPAERPSPAARAGSAEASAPAQLRITRGPDAGTCFRLTAAVTAIGRYRNCDIPLDHVTVSRRHAEIHRDAGGYTLVDAGSLNGTYLNRHPLEAPTTLADGDEVRIGIVRFIFHTNRI